MKSHSNPAPFTLIPGDFVIAVWHVTHVSGGKPWGFNIILARREGIHFGAKIAKGEVEGFALLGCADDAEAFAAVDGRADELVKHIVEKIPDTGQVRKDVARIMSDDLLSLVGRLNGLIGLTAEKKAVLLRRSPKKGA